MSPDLVSQVPQTSKETEMRYPEGFSFSRLLLLSQLKKNKSPTLLAIRNLSQHSRRFLSYPSTSLLQSQSHRLTATYLERHGNHEPLTRAKIFWICEVEEKAANASV